MAPASILVAEDQTDIRELLVMNLRGAGYAVEAVADGAAALASQSERASDLLVLDLMMPGLDGLEVTKALRARVKALLRRADLLRAAQSAGGAEPRILKNGALEIEPAKRQVRYRGAQ